METVEQRNAVAGTQGIALWFEFDGSLYRKDEFEHQAELITAQYKKVPTRLKAFAKPFEEAANTRETWTWKLQFSRFCSQYADHMELVRGNDIFERID